MKNPQAQAWTSLVVAMVVMGVVLFGTAGTLRYWRAWAYLAVVLVCSVPVTLYMIRDPVLLEGRTRFGPGAEQRAIQKIIVLTLFVPTLAVFIVPGLDRRFGWSAMPVWLSAVGDLLIVLSIWVSYRVFRENAFGAATVTVVKDQRVISTGPYAVVRNPMYSSAILFFVAMALALGSYWALLPAALTIPCFGWRLSDEEAFLRQNLPGYADYCAKVRWRLIPRVF